MLAGSWFATARAEAAEPAEGSVASGPEGVRSAPDALYTSYSNEALTALAAEWDTLDVHQRRALLTEVRQRMAEQGKQPGSGVIRIRTERRFGRLIRQPDGRVIRIETQIVQYRPVPEAAVTGRRGGYGVGFERRAGSVRQEQQDIPVSGHQAGPPVEPATIPARVPGAVVIPFRAPALETVP